MHHALYFLNSLLIAIALNFGALPGAIAQSDGAESPTSLVSAPADSSLALESEQTAGTDSEATVFLYMALGALIVILTAATLAIVIMAHRIAVAQRIRPLSGNRHHARNSL